MLQPLLDFALLGWLRKGFSTHGSSRVGARERKTSCTWWNALSPKQTLNPIFASGRDFSDSGGFPSIIDPSMRSSGEYPTAPDILRSPKALASHGSEVLTQDNVDRLFTYLRRHGTSFLRKIVRTSPTMSA